MRTPEPLPEPWRSAPEVLAEALSALEHRRYGLHIGFSTGIEDLDRALFGLHVGDLVVVAGRPAMGTTSLALNFARHTALFEGTTVAVCSPQLSCRWLMDKMLAAQARVSQSRIRVGELDQEERDRLVVAGDELREAPIHLLDVPAMDVDELVGWARQLKEAVPELDLLFLDRLDLLIAQGEGSADEVCSRLKRLADELTCGIVATSSLNRGPENRSNKRPKVSDLRHGKAILRRADVVLLLYRDEYYRLDSPDEGVAEVIVGRNRHNVTGTVRVAFEASCARFGDLPAIEITW